MTGVKVALVTGASSGIGRATAALLSTRGFKVFGTSRNAAEGDSLAEPISLVRLDVRDEDSVRSCVQTVLGRAGRIDALVNNAGCTLIGSLEETTLDEAKEVFETNLFGILRMSQAVLPVMRGQGYGRIANIGSVLGFLPGPYQAVYAATKHALEAYSESLDHEVRQFGIRVSVIEPAFTRTDIERNARRVNHPIEAYTRQRNRVLEALRQNIANGENPANVAAVVLEAVTSRSPKLRYPAGAVARFLSLLRRFAPSGLLDKGLRRRFDIGE
jgi:NAD(P)-dependent dehydrogenase (short-subunit alcohol dehydrogenase family)